MQKKEYVKLEFKKLASCWRSAKLDKNGFPYYTGLIDPEFNLLEGTRLFVYRSKKRVPNSPDIYIMLGIPSTDTTPVAPAEKPPDDGFEKEEDETFGDRSEEQERLDREEAERDKPKPPDTTPF